ncbi:MAG: DUF4105 domain-containing protein [Leptospirales bacterium]
MKKTPVLFVVAFILAFLFSGMIFAEADQKYKLQGDWTAQQTVWINQATRLLPEQMLGPEALLFVKYTGSHVLKKGQTLALHKSGTDRFVFWFSPGNEELKIAKQKLNLQRALIRAILWRYNEHSGWAGSREWLSINKWKIPIKDGIVLTENSKNGSAMGFTEPEARKSSLKDFLYFGSYYFLPDKPEKDVVKEQFRCRFLAQSEFFDSKINDMNPQFRSLSLQPTTQCQEFEKWARMDEIDQFEIILAAPSTVFIGSMFGHVFLRVISANENGVRPVMSSRSFGFVAETHGPIEADPFGIIKGVIGTYRTILLESPFAEMYRQYVVMEDRSMRRWKLNLNKADKRKLMVRMWTMMRSSDYRYYFFSNNCGTYLIDLINGIMPEESPILYANDGLSMPTATIDGYISATVNDTAFVEYIPDTFESMREEMLVASRKRKKEAEKIIHYLNIKENLKTGKKFKVSFQKATSANLQTRAEGYSEINEYTKYMTGSILVSFYSLNWYSAVIENYFSTKENLKQEKILNSERIRDLRKQLSVRKKRVVTDFLSLLTRTRMTKGNRYKENWDSRFEKIIKSVFSNKFNNRFEGYLKTENFLNNHLKPELVEMDESLKEEWNLFISSLRQLIVLRAYEKFDGAVMTTDQILRGLLITDPERNLFSQPYLQDILKYIDYSFVSNISKNLMQVQMYRYDLIKKMRKEGIRISELQREIFSPDQIQKEYNASFSHSGAQMISLQPYYFKNSTQTEYGFLWKTALVEEFFGEKRKAGFPYFSEMTLLKQELFTSVSNNGVEISNYKLMAVDFRQIRPKASEEKSFFVTPGAHFGIYYEIDNRVKTENITQIQMGAIFALFSRQRYEQLGFLEFDLSYKSMQTKLFSTEGIIQWVGVPVMLQIRLPFLGQKFGMNFIRLNLMATPWYNITNDNWENDFVVKITSAHILKEHAVLFEKSPEKGVRLFADISYKVSSPWGQPIPYRNGEFMFALGIRFN